MVADGKIPPEVSSAEFGRGPTESPSLADAAKNIGAAWAAASNYLATQAARLRLAFRTIFLFGLLAVIAAIFVGLMGWLYSSDRSLPASALTHDS